MDQWKADHENLAAKAKAEKYAKIIAKTVVLAGTSGDFGTAENFV